MEQHQISGPAVKLTQPIVALGEWRLGNSFGGDLDEVEVFEQPLLDYEISALYQAGRFGQCKQGFTVNDADGDGTPDPCDNCVNIPNAAQPDGDRDGVGDACDNCPSTPNTDCAGLFGPNWPILRNLRFVRYPFMEPQASETRWSR
jgi:hypothetical protein